MTALHLVYPIYNSLQCSFKCNMCDHPAIMDDTNDMYIMPKFFHEIINLAISLAERAHQNVLQ